MVDEPVGGDVGWRGSVWPNGACLLIRPELMRYDFLVDEFLPLLLRHNRVLNLKTLPQT